MTSSMDFLQGSDRLVVLKSGAEMGRFWASVSDGQFKLYADEVFVESITTELVE